MGGHLIKAAHQLQKLFSDLVRILHRLLHGSVRKEVSRKRRSFRNRWTRRSLNDFVQEVEDLFLGHLSPENLALMSNEIGAQLRASAKSSHISMLPSFNHSLPSGKEKGTYLALDVGGSTFRVALVKLAGKDEGVKILKMATSHIDEDVISMGKGFHCSDGTVGDDLRELIMEACRKRNLNVTLEAIVNDGSATLLSRAYTDPTTRMSLILGTGTNMAVHFPVHAIGIDKYGERSPEWFAKADHVITNTEISMFGGRVLQMTRWDDDLNRNHIKPDYQPLEYMCTGRYLGEIVRLIAAEAVQTAGLFGGQTPASMQPRYSLDTAILAYIEEDTSPSFQSSLAFLQKQHQFRVPPTPADLAFLKRVTHCVSQRAAAYLATAIHGLWCLRNESETPIFPATPESTNDEEILKIPANECTKDPIPLQVNIACDGSVINKYPNFRARCQVYLNQLTFDSKTSETSHMMLDSAIASKKASSRVEQLRSITLDLAPEGGIIGAAVAVAVAVPDDE
uniref:Phosphotransferase n=1 Tax=Coccidioides posadasii RMSCC 3488 TaxID=454284 RepID=A0A0J6FLX8_COCPO|nr:hexokinase-1 [Coccidioides posadasii RMSCC 3488]